MQALAKEINPLVLMIAIPLTCSLAFVLPVGTPPNSLVYAHQGYTTSEMAIPGVIVKIVSTIAILVCVGAIGYPMFNLGDTSPAWLEGYVSSNVSDC